MAKQQKRKAAPQQRGRAAAAQRGTMTRESQREDER